MSVDGHLHGVSRTFRGGRAFALVLVLLALSIVGATGLFSAPAQAAETVEYSAEEIAFITLLNEYRVANGRQSLMLSDVVSLAAQRHSSDMAKYGWFDHTTQQRTDYFSPGDDPWDRMWASGYTYADGTKLQTAMGENIAAGQTSAVQAFVCFEGSAGHKAAMLNPDYRVVGIGLVYAEGTINGWYWTVDFGGYIDSSAHGTGYYQQSDSRINYLGKWNSATSFQELGAWWRARTIYWADEKGAAALVSFNGTAVELFAQKGPGYGMAEVSLDGGPPQLVDFYFAGTASEKSVYSKSGLADTTHTITIRCLREKNPSSSGYAINLDAIRVMKGGSTPGSLVQAPQPDRYQQDDDRLAYTGGWVDAYTWWLASGCTYKYVNSPGASVNVTFDGTYLAWVGKKASNYGMAKVSLDGGEPFTVDLYSPYTRYKQKIYDTGLLEDGVHTLTIYWMGAKCAPSSGCYISADTFDVFGEIIPAEEAPPISWSYDQSDSRITYLGQWSTRWDSRASAWSFYYAAAQGAGALVNFDGTSVELLAKKGPCYGLVELVLLNEHSAVVDSQVVDLYAPLDVFRQTIYSKADLPNDSYTLMIKATGDMNPSALMPLINIDGLTIKGYLTEGPQTTRVQQTEPVFDYEGSSWAMGTTWSASGGSFHSVDEDGAKVTVDFEGTYLSWLARTTPWYGKAKVTLDGDYDNSVTIDLYSPGVAWKVPVYDTGLLAPGHHTLEIEWTGDSFWSSWGTAIAVDAADVLVTSD